MLFVIMIKNSTEGTLMFTKELTPREQKSLKTKQMISNAAIELFQTYGYEKTTIQDISKATETSVGSIYHHFGSKEGILNFALREYNDICITDDNWENKIQNPYDTIMEFLLRYAESWENLGMELAKQMTLPFKTYFYAEDHYSEQLASFTSLSHFIKCCQEYGNFETDLSSDEIANYILTIGRCFVHDWSHFGVPNSLHEQVLKFMPRILRSFMLN